MKPTQSASGSIDRPHSGHRVEITPSLQCRQKSSSQVGRMNTEVGTRNIPLYLHRGHFLYSWSLFAIAGSSEERLTCFKRRQLEERLQAGSLVAAHKAERRKRKNSSGKTRVGFPPPGLL